MEDGSVSPAAVVVGVNRSDSLIAVQNKSYSGNGVCDEQTWHAVVRHKENAIAGTGGPYHNRILELSALTRKAIVRFVLSFVSRCAFLVLGLMFDDAFYYILCGGGFVMAAFYSHSILHPFTIVTRYRERGSRRLRPPSTTRRLPMRCRVSSSASPRSMTSHFASS